MRPHRDLKAAAYLTPVLVFLFVYAPAVGRGFISDDFGWILQSRASTIHDLVALFSKNHGFYRPLVALSFAANYSLSGANALGYGLTNLALCLSGALLIAGLFRAAHLSTAAALFGAALWLMNFHGINMALLWISGRTALLLVVAASAAALAALTRRPLLSVACAAAALLSKEEAVALPAIIVAWLYIFRNERDRVTTREWVVLVAGMVLVLAGYGLLRTNAGAMTAATAPYYYRFTLDPATLARNAAEYFDRACTVSAAAMLLAWLILPRGHSQSSPLSWRVGVAGAIWIAGGYAITVFLPVRSSLYSCFPSVGAAFIAADFCSRRWNAAPEARQRLALVMVILVSIACAPAYMIRNHRWTDLAALSHGVLEEIAGATADVREGTTLLFIDGDRARRVNLQSAFGTLLGDAVALETGRRFPVWVEPPLGDAALAGLQPPCSGCEVVRLQLEKGHIRRNP